MTQGSAVGGTLICTCVCHSEDRDAFLNKLFEAVAWRTVDRDTGETRLWRTEAEARAYAKTKEPACVDCNGTGAVPAGGWETEADVDNGYVACTTCSAPPGLADVPDVPDVRPTASEPVPAVPTTGDRNHHLTAEGSERLVTWAKERQEA